MATGMTSTDRRAHPRTPERIAFSLQSEEGLIQAETTNLSAAGAYCSSERFIPPMTKLQVNFELPHGRGTSRISCEGVVVRVEPVATNLERWRYQLAIWFSEVSERDRSTISQFVQQRLAASSSS